MSPTAGARRLGLGWLLAIYAFLYLPIASLVAGSFNASPLASVWGGATLRWYGALWHDHEIIDALQLTLLIALISATLSVLLGTLTALVLVRYRRFRGRALFESMANAPLVMPEVIVGLSLLLLLVACQQWLGVPERGVVSISMGHTLLGMAYAAVVVRARLLELDSSLEEAALDLGARPLQVFWLVTLPLITPSLLSAWLLAFTLSLDDVVISAFLSGPGSNTLPIVVFSRAKLGLDPTVNVVATLTVALVGLALLIGHWGLHRPARPSMAAAPKPPALSSEPPSRSPP